MPWKGSKPVADIHAFGLNWEIPAPLKEKLDLVVSDWVEANPPAPGGPPAWADITGKPSTFPAAAPTWASVSGKPTTFAPAAHTHAITDVTGLRAELDSKSGDAFTPEKYGAKGDGTTDDSDAIRAAILAANGQRVLLKSGAIYRVDSAVEVTGVDVDLATDGVEKATIYHAGQSFTPLTIRGQENVKTTSLARGVSVNVSEWNLTNVDGIKPGQLMTVISSALWYHDPRDVARKSELHVVDRVEGANVYTRDPAFDTYILPGETVEVSFHDPVRVSVDNVVFMMDRPAPSNSAPEKIAFIVEHALEPHLTRVGSENGVGAGISIRHSYRPKTSDTTTINSCGYYTGYGIQIYGCTHAQIVRPYASGCRRGTDISGNRVVSRATRVRHGVNTGGGRDSRGAPYGYTMSGQWSGLSPQYGWGTHGPADDTVFDSCLSVDMHHHYTLRGRNETVLNPKMRGRSYLATIVVSFGTNLTVRGAQTTNGYEGGNGQSGTNPTAASSTDQWTPEGFVHVLASYNGAEGFITLENNRVVVRRNVLSFVDASVAPKSVTMRNNDVVFYPQSGLSQSVVSCTTGTADSSGWQLSGNVQRSPNGSKTSIPLSTGVGPALNAW